MAGTQLGKSMNGGPPPASAPVQDASAENENDLANFDVEAAAEKLRCGKDQDSVCSAIDILVDELDERGKKIAFFEELFGLSAEYLMACKEDLLKYEDVNFAKGTGIIQGSQLQFALRKKLGKNVPMQRLAGKRVPVQVPAEEYAVAVVLPAQVKKRLEFMMNRLGTENSSSTINDKDLEKIIRGESTPSKMTTVDPQSAPNDFTSVPKVPSANDTVPADGNEKKRGRPAVISDAEDEDQDGERGKRNKMY